MGCCIGRKKVLPAKQSKRSVSIASRRVWQTQRGEKDATRRDVKVNPSVEQKYTIFSLIGKGEFGHVLRVEHKQSKIPYAIKVIDLTRDIKASSQLELEILTKVKHKYVIRLYDYQRSSTRLYLVMDLATGGELMDRISLMGNFDECDATRVLYMILDGLKYLHSLGITHRDMKPENILYYHPGADSKIIITDFGLSAMRAASQSPASYLMKTDCGTIEYMAPEVITRNRYTNAVDMWSMGVIAFIILSGRLPFPLNGNIMSTLRMICFCKFDFEGEPWNDVSEDAKDFIRLLLTFNPSERLTASDALEHKWITSKMHNKQNLQKSISSNWSNSCVSLKNEKGLKRQHAKTKDSTMSSKNAKNSKPSHEPVCRKQDDELHRRSAKRAKRVTQVIPQGSQRDILVNTCGHPHTHGASKSKADAANCNRHGEIDKNTTVNENAQETPACRKTQVAIENANKLPKISAGDSERKQPLTGQDSTDVETNSSNARDFNGNVAFVERVPSSTRNTGSRADDATSSRRNLADSEKGGVHLTELSPLNRTRTSKRVPLLPPIRSSTVNPTVI